MNTRRFLTLGLIVLGLTAVGPAGGSPTPGLIDDFSRADGRSALGAEWRFFADTVMGGVSRGRAVRDSLDGQSCLRLTGQVSLENNGGFVQVALPVDDRPGPLNAGTWTGIRLVVRGNGRDYDVHLRTGQTRLPWQYYSATFPTTNAWTTVDLPFDAFRPAALSARLDPAQLTRIGIVAARRAFTADVAVARVSFYR